MTSLTAYLLAGTLCLALGGWLVFLLAMRTGQWDDTEDIKYQLFDNEESE